MRYERARATRTGHPVGYCRQCHTPTEHPRQGACVPCYERSRRTGEPLHDRRNPAQLALPLARTVWSDVGICRRSA